MSNQILYLVDYNMFNAMVRCEMIIFYNILSSRFAHTFAFLRENCEFEKNGQSICWNYGSEACTTTNF